MQITMVSNYINHHQIPFCKEMKAQIQGTFTFIQTEQMEEERVTMGWSVEGEDLSYVKYYDKEPEVCEKLIMDSDIVIFGGAPEKLIHPRLDAGKIVFRYSERIYRNGMWRALSPRGLWEKYRNHIKYRRYPVYMLCVGGYVPAEFKILGAYPNKMLKWGYFPECGRKSEDELIENKPEKLTFLWVGRMIRLKHPEKVLLAAHHDVELLHGNFNLLMIGSGEMEEELKQIIKEKGMEDYVTLLGYRSPAEVRQYMEQAHVLIQSSDRREGWGAVVNEAMDSGCAIIGSHLAGAVTSLVQYRHNGLVFDGSGSQWGQLFTHIRYMEIQHREKELEIWQRNAIRDIRNKWSPRVAAARFLRMAEDMLEAKDNREPVKNWLKTDRLPVSGPCSKAQVTMPYQMLRKKYLEEYEDEI